MWPCSRWQLCFIFGKSFFYYWYTDCTLFSPVGTEDCTITSWSSRYFCPQVNSAVRPSLRSKQERLMRRHIHISPHVQWLSIRDQPVSWICTKSGTRLIYKKFSNALEFPDSKSNWNVTCITRVQCNRTIILTYSMKQSPSWEANPFAANQKILRILWYPKVHYRILKWQSPVPILSHLDPVHTPISSFLNIHLNIILPSTPGSPQWSLSLIFHHQNSVHASPLPHTRYMPRQSHSPWFYHSHNSMWGVQIIKLLIM